MANEPLKETVVNIRLVYPAGMKIDRQTVQGDARSAVLAALSGFVENYNTSAASEQSPVPKRLHAAYTGKTGIEY